MCFRPAFFIVNVLSCNNFKMLVFIISLIIHKSVSVDFLFMDQSQDKSSPKSELVKRYFQCRNELHADIPTGQGMDNFDVPSLCRDGFASLDDCDTSKPRTKVALWPRGEVVVQLESGFTKTEMLKLKCAILYFRAFTCVTFLNKAKLNQTYTDYVYLTKSHKKGGCFTELIGKKGGRQLLNLDQYSDHCWEHGTIIHELMHVLGFFHEQSRLDRDKYIVVHWNKLPKSMYFQYWTTKELGYDHKDVGKYDFGSVMHYSRYLGFTLALSAKLHGEDYEQQAEENDMMGQRTEPSDEDTNKLNELYCPNLVTVDKKQDFQELASYINCSKLTPLMKLSLYDVAKCCGPTFFNAESHECCYGHVLPVDKRVKLSNKTDFQCDRRMKKHERCITHDCCNKKLVPLAPGLSSTRDENAGCCHNISYNSAVNDCCRTRSYDYILYDTATKMCCDYQVVPLVSLSENGTARCCQNVSYDFATHDCCDGQVVPLAGGLYLTISDYYGADVNYADCCGNISYNIQTQACCLKYDSDGKCLGLLNVVPLAPGPRTSRKECCGGISYNTDTHSCCNHEPYNKSENHCCKDKVVPLGPGIDTSLEDKVYKSCCRYVSYNKYTHHCCYNNVVPLSPWTEEEGKIGRVNQCCQNASYNSRVHDCCKDKVVPRPNGKDYWERTRCCGDISIDPDTHRCCGKVPYLRAINDCCSTDNGYLVVPLVSGLNSSDVSHARCCGGVSYNYQTHRCCDNQIVAPAPGKSSDLYCCRNVSYNTHTHECCRENVVIKPFASEMDTNCCHSVAYYPDTHTCCEGEVVPLPHGLKSQRNVTCCANVSFNIATDDCCEEKVVPKPRSLKISRNARCCARVSYSSATDACCENNVVPLASGVTSESDSECCANVSYSSATHHCCENKVVSSSVSEESYRKCCASVTYSYATHTCCNNKVVSLDSSLTTSLDWIAGCCQDVSFNQVTHACCQNKVVPLASGLTSSHKWNVYSGCCNNVSYNTNNHACCQNKLVSFTSKQIVHCVKCQKQWNTRCCAGALYNIMTQICCRNKVYVKNDNSNCCGNVAYDPSIEDCCKRRVYDITKNGCCDEQVVPLANGLSYAIDWNAACCGTISYDTNTNDCQNSVVV